MPCCAGSGMLNTHMNIYMYKPPHHCLKFWIRTAEDMNHCVIGLGSSAGQNMNDGLLTHRAENVISRRITRMVKSLLLPRYAKVRPDVHTKHHTKHWCGCLTCHASFAHRHAIWHHTSGGHRCFVKCEKHRLCKKVSSAWRYFAASLQRGPSWHCLHANVSSWVEAPLSYHCVNPVPA